MANLKATALDSNQEIKMPALTLLNVSGAILRNEAIILIGNTFRRCGLALIINSYF